MNQWLHADSNQGNIVGMKGTLHAMTEEDDCVFII